MYRRLPPSNFYQCSRTSPSSAFTRPCRAFTRSLSRPLSSTSSAFQLDTGTFFSPLVRVLESTDGHAGRRFVQSLAFGSCDTTVRGAEKLRLLHRWPQSLSETLSTVRSIFYVWWLKHPTSPIPRPDAICTVARLRQL